MHVASFQLRDISHKGIILLVKHVRWGIRAYARIRGHREGQGKGRGV